MIPESGAGDRRMLRRGEHWNAGMVPESEARSAGMIPECRDGFGKRGSKCRKSERFSCLYRFRFLVYSILAGGVPVKVELVEELGPVSAVRSRTADPGQNVVHR